MDKLPKVSDNTVKKVNKALKEGGDEAEKALNLIKARLDADKKISGKGKGKDKDKGSSGNSTPTTF